MPPPRLFAVFIFLALAIFTTLPTHAGELSVKCVLKTAWEKKPAGFLHELNLTDPDDEEWEVLDKACDFSSVHTLLIHGEIDQTLERAMNSYYALRMVKTAGKTQSGAQSSVILTSRGGSLNAAQRIGRLLRNMQAAVYVDGSCLSSCVFLLAGGVKRYVYGHVGVHRPFSRAKGAEESLDIPWENETIRKKTFAYLNDMRIPVDLYDLMNSVPPRTMHILDAEELKQYRLNDLERSALALQEQDPEDTVLPADAGEESDDDTYANYPHAKSLSAFSGLPDIP